MRQASRKRPPAASPGDPVGIAAPPFPPPLARPPRPTASPLTRASPQRRASLPPLEVVQLRKRGCSRVRGGCCQHPDRRWQRRPRSRGFSVFESCTTSLGRGGRGGASHVSPPSRQIDPIHGARHPPDEAGAELPATRLRPLPPPGILKDSDDTASSIHRKGHRYGIAPIQGRRATRGRSQTVPTRPRQRPLARRQRVRHGS